MGEILCQNCGTVYDEEIRFCAVCGSEIVSPDEPKRDIPGDSKTINMFTRMNLDPSEKILSETDRRRTETVLTDSEYQVSEKAPFREPVSGLDERNFQSAIKPVYTSVSSTGGYHRSAAGKQKTWLIACIIAVPVLLFILFNVLALTDAVNTDPFESYQDAVTGLFSRNKTEGSEEEMLPYDEQEAPDDGMAAEEIRQPEEENDETQPVTARDEPIQSGKRYRVATAENSRLNLRKEPSTDADILTQIPSGTILVIDGWSDDGQWAKTSFDGHTGWVYDNYIMEIS